MDSVSSVIVVSCDQKTKGDSLVELLLGDLPQVCVKDSLNVYPWHISTKYYEVSVNLCVLNKKELQSAEFSDGTEGVVLYFDCDGSDWLEKVNGWLPFLREFEPEVKILLCKKCDELRKVEVQEWCLREKYELVEVNGVGEDEDFPETVGMARVKQALEAHVWPHLEMKDRREPTKVSELLSGLNTNQELLLPSNRAPELAQFLSDALEQDTTSETLDFENLFSQLMSMKQKASAMPAQERKDFAEKVVTAYWNAIGGDSDELSDDSSSAGDPDYKML